MGYAADSQRGLTVPLDGDDGCTATLTLDELREREAGHRSDQSERASKD